MTEEVTQADYEKEPVYNKALVLIWLKLLVAVSRNIVKIWHSYVNDSPLDHTHENLSVIT